MPIFTNPTGYVGGSAEGDTFIFTQRPSGWVTVDALGGVDRLEVDVASADAMWVRVIDPYDSGMFHATFRTGPYDPQVVVYEVEDVDITGSLLNDDFELRIGGTLANLSVNFDGGQGTDFLSLDVTLFVGPFDFVVNGSSITSSFGSFANFERFSIRTGSGNDTITTGAGNDEVSTGAGADVVSTGGGNDSISSESSGGSVDGGDGYDFYSGYFNVPSALSVNIGETVTVSNGIVVTNVEGMSIGTGSGDDEFSVSRAIGGTVSGGAGNDVLAIIGAWGTTGLQFTIQAHSGTQLDGSVGSDLEFNGFESLLLTGGQHDDQFLISGAYVGSAISIDGGNGTDFVHIDFRAFANATTFIVGADGSISGNRGGQFANIESFGLAGGELNDTLVAGSGDDVLAGGGGADQLTGGAGRDYLLGEEGNDTLQGGADSDTLSGGADTDTLTGGSGTDAFRDSAEFLNGDTITDFAANDRIVIADATLADFTFSLSSNTLTYTGGTLTLAGGFSGNLVASEAVDGGVQIALINDVRNDFNGDGRSDILWRNVDGQLSNWLGQANGGFVQNNANAASVVPTAWQVAGTGDFNGDGRDDILWRNTDGQLSNWLGTASGGFVQNNANAAAAVPVAWQVVGTGDFNGDGRDDILWRNSNGTVSDWLGTATGGFTPNDANAARFVPTSWSVVGTGDFNGDGRDDILWRNSNGQVSDWLGQANGGFVLNDAIALTNVDTAWHVVGTGDFNGDGRDDILWRNDNGQLSNWLGQANGGFVNNGAVAGTFVPLAWSVVAVGDYNGDGRDDILWRHTDGTVSDWLGNANGSFTPNDANAAAPVPTSWEVQPDNMWI